MSKQKITGIRKKIDAVDDKLLALLNERARHVIEMGQVKQKMDMKVFDPRRERDIFARITKSNKGPLTVDAIVRIFERIIDESRRLERIEAFEREAEEE